MQGCSAHAAPPWGGQGTYHRRQTFQAFSGRVWKVNLPWRGSRASESPSPQVVLWEIAKGMRSSPTPLRQLADFILFAVFGRLQNPESRLLLFPWSGDSYLKTSFSLPTSGLALFREHFRKKSSLLVWPDR